MYAEENKKTQDFLRNQINKLFSYEALCFVCKAAWMNYAMARFSAW
jgi:hypothetical protein